MNEQTLLYVELAILSSTPVIALILVVALWKHFDNEYTGKIERFGWCFVYAWMIDCVLYITVLPVCFWIVLLKH